MQLTRDGRTVEVQLTGQTCGDACWHAREDICRCSCGGVNHGILRQAGAEQPARTRRITGAVYQMAAVEVRPGPQDCRAQTMRPLEDMERRVIDRARASGVYGDEALHSRYGVDNWPCYLRAAGESEVQRWPELAAWRGYSNGRYWAGPLVLWVRADHMEWAA